MKVCVDMQAATSRRAGIGRYTASLVEHLPLSDHDELVLFFFDFMRRNHSFGVPGATMRPARCCPGRLAQLAWKHLDWPPFERFSGPADLYHFPNFVLPPLRSGKAVVTIHDLSFMRFPQFTEDANLAYLTTRIRDTVTRADAIITISRRTAADLEEMLGLDPSIVFPIHLGVDSVFRPSPAETVDRALKNLGISGPYILTVGTLEPRKNLPFLVDVFEQLKGFDGQLVIAGMKGWKTEPILRRIGESSRSSAIRILDYVSDDELPALYTGAEMLVCASFYEGFGFPPLEAMACGTPVVSSDGGSLAEVLDNGAIVIPDFEIDRWVSEIDNLLNDREKRHSLTEAGHRRASTFTWQETGRQTWDVYRKVCE
ncbi:MAG: glycosyltransferase family 4 protein [Lentisphaerae bacterium]|nr:glycosyltransferase family 4 protein [Lentisphaerota bacterium]